MSFALILRNVAAILAAFAVTLILLIGVELFSSVVHPVPADFAGTTEEMCAHVARYPHWVLGVVVPMWGVTALVGTWIAGRLGSRGSALLMAALLVIAVLFNLAMLPYPLWFKIVQPIAVLAAVVFGYRWSRRRPRAAT